MLDKLPSSICPLVAGFGFDTTSGQVSSDLSAGAPRFELWTTDVVPVYQLNFDLDFARYRIFCDFYFNTLVRGSKWFEADLILNDPTTPETLELRFLADSTLSPRSNGRRWTFSLQAVARNPDYSDDPEYIENLNDLLEAYGSVENIIDAFNALNQTANIDLPVWWNP